MKTKYSIFFGIRKKLEDSLASHSFYETFLTNLKPVFIAKYNRPSSETGTSSHYNKIRSNNNSSSISNNNNNSKNTAVVRAFGLHIVA